MNNCSKYKLRIVYTQQAAPCLRRRGTGKPIAVVWWEQMSLTLLFLLFFPIFAQSINHNKNNTSKFEWKSNSQDISHIRKKYEDQIFNRFKAGSVGEFDNISHKKQLNKDTVFKNNINDDWEKLAGPAGGSVREFYQFFNKIYALTDQDLFVLEGKTWKAFNIEKIISNTIRCLQVFESGRIILGDDDHLLFSDDFGNTWQRIDLGDLSTSPTDILMTPDGEMLVTTTDGILKSSDSKVDLEPFSLDGEIVITASLDYNGNLWASTMSGIYKSNYNDLEWTKIDLEPDYYKRILFDSIGVVYTFSDYKVLRSKNEGKTWDEITGGLFIDILVDENDNLIITSSTKIVCFSGDNIIWESPMTNDFLLTSFVSEDKELLIGTLGGGAFLYNQITSSFIHFSEGMNASTIIGILDLKDGSIFTCTTAEKLYLSFDNGNTWEVILTDVWSRCMETARDGSIYVAANGGIIKSTDFGKTWVELDVNVYPYYIYSLDISDDSQTVCAGSSHGEVFISHDGGNNFKRIRDYDYKFVEAVEIIDSNSFLIYPEELLLTNDGGKSYINVDNGRFRRAEDIETDSSGNIYLAGLSTLYRSLDGENWEELAPDLPGAEFINFDEFNNVYVTNPNGSVFVSYDNFLTWETLAIGAQGTSYWSFCLRKNGYIFNGSQDRGLYRSKIEIKDPTTNTEIKQTIPLNYSLLQNYPNPFNASTKIKFSLNKTSDVKIIIYDLNGRVISDLLNTKLNVGYHTIEWEAGNYPSGIYFYKLEVDHYSQTKGMLLLK